MIVLGRRTAITVISALAGFTCLLLASSFATFRGWLDPQTAVANVVVLCLVSSATFLRMRGPLQWDLIFFRITGSVLDPVRSASK
jgi:hypothetical protein